MTKFRYPDGWNTRRSPGERPDLSGTWLDPNRADRIALGHSYQYWTRIHWATPPWLTEEMLQDMRSIYEKANPAFEHVDHIVPLEHPLVCGLNVPWNLQILNVLHNLRKSNNYWPDCPDHLCPVKNLPEDMFGDPEPHQQALAI